MIVQELKKLSELQIEGLEYGRQVIAADQAPAIFLCHLENGQFLRCAANFRNDAEKEASLNVAKAFLRAFPAVAYTGMARVYLDIREDAEPVEALMQLTRTPTAYITHADAIERSSTVRFRPLHHSDSRNQSDPASPGDLGDILPSAYPSREEMQEAREFVTQALGGEAQKLFSLYPLPNEHSPGARLN